MQLNLCPHEFTGKLHLGIFFSALAVFWQLCTKIHLQSLCPHYCWKQHAFCMCMEPRKSYWKTTGMEEKKVLTEMPIWGEVLKYVLVLAQILILYFLVHCWPWVKYLEGRTERLSHKLCSKWWALWKASRKGCTTLDVKRQVEQVTWSKVMLSVPPWGPESRWRMLRRSLRRRKRRI